MKALLWGLALIPMVASAGEMGFSKILRGRFQSSDSLLEINCEADCLFSVNASARLSEGNSVELNSRALSVRLAQNRDAQALYEALEGPVVETPRGSAKEFGSEMLKLSCLRRAIEDSRAFSCALEIQLR